MARMTSIGSLSCFVPAIVEKQRMYQMKTTTDFTGIADITH
jgi:hypothetical protein